MKCTIAHPTWLNGTPKRQPTTRLVPIASETTVEIEEVPDAGASTAFRIVSKGGVTNLVCRHGSDDVWWPLMAGTGKALPAQMWARLMGRSANDGKAEFGISAVLDKELGWPENGLTENDVIAVKDDYRDLCRTIVLKAASEVMVWRGTVWRRLGEPVYRGSPSRQNSCVVPLGLAAETAVDFHASLARGEDPAKARHMTLLRDPAMVKGLYFRVDERDKALSFGKRLFRDDVELASKRPVTTVLSPLLVQAAALAFAEVVQPAQASPGVRAKLVQDVFALREAIQEMQPINRIVPILTEVEAGAVGRASDGADEQKRDLHRALRRLKADAYLRRLSRETVEVVLGEEAEPMPAVGMG